MILMENQIFFLQQQEKIASRSNELIFLIFSCVADRRSRKHFIIMKERRLIHKMETDSFL